MERCPFCHPAINPEQRVVLQNEHCLFLHLHVIPRFRDEPLAGKGIRYWLKSEDNRRHHTGPH